jgi:hypothetical protein
MMLKKIGKKFRFSCFTKECITYDGRCPIMGFMNCPKQLANNVYNRIKPPTNIMPLGRWKPEQDNSKTYSKVDNANEDHCGPCGNTIIKNIHKTRNFIIPK